MMRMIFQKHLVPFLALCFLGVKMSLMHLFHITLTGSKFSELEVKYFHDLLEHLSVEGFMNTGEADQKRPVGWSISQGQHSLKKLQSQGWLSRDDRNYWILGARSFLELNLSMKEINPDMEIPQIMIY